MKKLLFVLAIFILITAAFSATVAYAAPAVTTYGEYYRGEYNHGGDAAKLAYFGADSVIVFGQVTELPVEAKCGIAVKAVGANAYTYFEAKNVDSNGKFGIALSVDSFKNTGSYYGYAYMKNAGAFTYATGGVRFHSAETAATALSPATDLAMTNGKLTWTASENADKYLVQVKEGEGKYVDFGVVTTTSFDAATALKAKGNYDGKTYSFKVISLGDSYLPAEAVIADAITMKAISTKAQFYDIADESASTYCVLQNDFDLSAVNTVADKTKEGETSEDVWNCYKCACGLCATSSNLASSYGYIFYKSGSDNTKELVWCVMDSLDATLDGNGKKVTLGYSKAIANDLTTMHTMGGLFNQITGTGLIRNLIFDTDVSAMIKYKHPGNGNVYYSMQAGFVNANFGTVEDCYIKTDYALSYYNTDIGTTVNLGSNTFEVGIYASVIRAQYGSVNTSIIQYAAKANTNTNATYTDVATRSLFMFNNATTSMYRNVAVITAQGANQTFGSNMHYRTDLLWPAILGNMDYQTAYYYVSPDTFGSYSSIGRIQNSSRNLNTGINQGLVFNAMKNVTVRGGAAYFMGVEVA